MWEHTRDQHEGVYGPNNGQGDYMMKFESKQKSSFARQVRESVLIKRSDEGKDKEYLYKQDESGSIDEKEKVEIGVDTLNGRGEWFAPKCVEVIFHQW